MSCHEAMEQDRSDKAPVWAEAAAQAAEAAAWVPAARGADACGVLWPPDRLARASAPSAEPPCRTRAACRAPACGARSAAPPWRARREENRGITHGTLFLRRMIAKARVRRTRHETHNGSSTAVAYGEPAAVQCRMCDSPTEADRRAAADQGAAVASCLGNRRAMGSALGEERTVSPVAPVVNAGTRNQVTPYAGTRRAGSRAKGPFSAGWGSASPGLRALELALHSAEWKDDQASGAARVCTHGARVPGARRPLAAGEHATPDRRGTGAHLSRFRVRPRQFL
jgi:hypothetical protein